MQNLIQLAKMLGVQLELVRDASGQLFGVSDPLALLHFNQWSDVRTLLIKWGKNPV
jgi:hypothetical protein